MKIIKSLNNNMVLAVDTAGKEKICQGKGIGFQRKRGDLLDPDSVERTFVPETESDRSYFLQLFSEIPGEYWEIAEDVVRYAKEVCGLRFTDMVLLPLCDHMAGSVERYKNGVTLANPMLWDIRRIYAEEFRVGKYALELLEERFQVRMKEDEAAFLAYHFVNAELRDMGNASGAAVVSPDYMTRLIGSVLDIVQDSFQVELSEEDWNYQRFLTHLKFFARRIAERRGHAGEADEELYEELSERYHRVNLCVNRIADYVLIEYHYDLSIDERLYLLIHIERVTRKFRKKK